MVITRKGPPREALLVCAVIILVAPVGALATDDAAASGEMGPRLQVRAAMMIHNFTNPGISLGIDRSIALRGGSEIYVPLNLTFYLHPKNSRVFYLNAGIGYRLQSRGRFFAAGSLCLGYLHSFVDGDLYTGNGGAVGRVRDHGQAGFMPYVDLRLGLDRLDGRFRRLAPYVQVMAFGQYPYNGYVLPHFGFQLGTSILLTGERMPQ